MAYEKAGRYYPYPVECDPKFFHRGNNEKRHGFVKGKMNSDMKYFGNVVKNS